MAQRMRKEEDDRKRRGGGRDRASYSGPTQTFTEKKHYKPSVNIEYIDDGKGCVDPEKFNHGRNLPNTRATIVTTQMVSRLAAWS